MLRLSLLCMRVEKDDSVAGSKTRQVGEVVYGVETQAKPPSFGNLQFLDRVANIAYAFKIAVGEYGVVEHQQAWPLKWRERVRGQ